MHLFELVKEFHKHGNIWCLWLKCWLCWLYNPYLRILGIWWLTPVTPTPVRIKYVLTSYMTCMCAQIWSQLRHESTYAKYNLLIVSHHNKVLIMGSVLLCSWWLTPVTPTPVRIKYVLTSYMTCMCAQIWSQLRHESTYAKYNLLIVSHHNKVLIMGSVLLCSWWLTPVTPTPVRIKYVLTSYMTCMCAQIWSQLRHESTYAKYNLLIVSHHNKVLIIGSVLLCVWWVNAAAKLPTTMPCSC